MALAELATYQSRIHAEIVRGRLAGHGIEAILFDEGVGVCGKAGQSVPAGVGQPTLLIEGLTVGGTAA